MLRKTLSILVIAVTFFGSSISYASNFHEHLFSIPFKANFVGFEDKLFEVKPSINVKDILVNEDFWELISNKFWPHLSGEYDRFEEASIEELFVASGIKSKKSFLMSFLDFKPYLSSSTSERKIAYQANENLRKFLLKRLSTEEFLSVFERYFQQEPIENRKVISATCTRTFFKDKKRALALKALAKRYGTDLVYRSSLQRKLLVEGGLHELPKEVLEAMDEKLILGIDIVASISEKADDYPNEKELITPRISELIKFAQERELVLFLHAFENANEGSFYDALREALRNEKGSLYMEVGHIQKLNSQWIAFFKSLPNIHTQFHCCPSSDLYLCGDKVSVIQNIGKEIRDNGFSLFLGSDGRGILPHSSYLEMRFYVEDDYSKGQESFLSLKSKMTQALLNESTIRFGSSLSNVTLSKDS